MNEVIIVGFVSPYGVMTICGKDYKKTARELYMEYHPDDGIEDSRDSVDYTQKLLKDDSFIGIDSCDRVVGYIDVIDQMTDNQEDAIMKYMNALKKSGKCEMNEDK